MHLGVRVSVEGGYAPEFELGQVILRSEGVVKTYQDQDCRAK